MPEGEESRYTSGAVNFYPRSLIWYLPLDRRDLDQRKLLKTWLDHNTLSDEAGIHILQRCMVVRHLILKLSVHGQTAHRNIPIYSECIRSNNARWRMLAELYSE